jgi:hypothetical protein
MFLFAVDVSQVRNATLAGSVVPVIIGLLLFRIVAGVFARVFILVIALVVGGVVYLQRQEITDCVNDARVGIEQLDAIETPNIDCKIFGFDLSIQP